MKAIVFLFFSVAMAYKALIILFIIAGILAVYFMLSVKPVTNKTDNKLFQSPNKTDSSVVIGS